MPTAKLAKHGWKILFLGIAIFYLFGLGVLPLVGPDEPRYAEVAREMLARRDLITPTLGGIPWFEKPSLLYWMMIASYRVLGVTEYAARLGPALCGLLTAALVFWLGRTVERSAPPTESEVRTNLGEWSALVFLSSLGAIAFSRSASFDIVLTMTLSGALSCFFVWLIRDRDGTKAPLRLLCAFYVFIGLSLLAKGLVGIVLPFGVIAAYFLIRREWPNRRFVFSLTWGLPIALIVAASWYGPMFHRHGWTFVDQFIIQHHFARFLSNKYHHPQPFYFYVPTIAWLSTPWSLFLLSAFISVIRGWRKKRADRFSGFCLVWVVLPLVFFSLSGSKLPGYVLPVMPAVALLVGNELTGVMDSAARTRLIRVTGILLIVLSIVGGWFAFRELALPIWLVSVGLLLALLTGGFALVFAARRTAVPILALFSFAVMGLGIEGARVLEARSSVRDVVQAANARGYASTPVFCLLCDDRTAEFYAGGRLMYEPTGEPARFEGAQDVAAAIHQKGGVGLVLIESRWEKQLTNYQAVQTEKIADNGRVTLFAVRVR
ncbi:MAG TPA: phospholipid carrier-dependent glycosyltransferase [Pyrinomonadaceae bacterium]